MPATETIPTGETRQQEDAPTAPPAPAPDATRGTQSETAPAAPVMLSAAEVVRRAREWGLAEGEVAEMQDEHARQAFSEPRFYETLARRWNRRAAEEPPAHRSGSGRVVLDESEKVRDAMMEALCHRVTPTFEMRAGGEEFRYRSLLDLGRELMERSGQRVRGVPPGHIADQMLMRTMTTSDFPSLMAGFAERTLRNAYEEAPQTFLDFVRVVDVPNFKKVSRVQLSGTLGFEPLAEGGEIRHGSLSDAAEEYQIRTFAKGLTLSRQTIVNDELDAFARLPQMYGAEARGLEGDLVYGILTSVPAAPVMGDGHNLFDTTHHGNLASSGAKIDPTTLSAARAAMRKQTAPNGRALNLVAAFLLVGSDKETEAEQVVSPNFVPAKVGDINVFSGKLAVRADDRIPGNMWFLAARPGQIDTIELAYLRGARGPQLSQRIQTGRDGVVFECLFDVGAAPIDWRGFYRNPGN